VSDERQLGKDDPDQARGLLAAAEKIADLPGLLWKLWGYDGAEHVAESIYLFETEAVERGHARAAGSLSTRLTRCERGMATRRVAWRL
jgi:hypothetical protein